MKLGKIYVESKIPKQLEGLEQIANNFWFCSHNEAIELFKSIDEELYAKCENNPVVFLKKVENRILQEKIQDDSFMNNYNNVINKFYEYLNTDKTWFNNNYNKYKDKKIAYFSAEYGINEILPIYSGGLGVLSGDHLKSASDMGIPLVGIGLFYRKGYFNQEINHEGWQYSTYPELNPENLPLEKVVDKNANDLILKIPLAGKNIFFKAWKVKVGRINLYLLDTNVEKNSYTDREITSSLYGGNEETRISQEIVMGIGGIILLNHLGIEIDIYHMNEGHQAFVALELIKKYMKERDLDFNTAKQIVSSKCVFTTHTPVPAGFDRFPLNLIKKYLSNYIKALRLTNEEFMKLGSNFGNYDKFNMATFGLNFSYYRNAVSKLHGKVTRQLFSWMWKEVPNGEIPIGHVTNGIHTLSWLHPKLKNLFDDYLGENWENEIYNSKMWEKIDDIPANKLWEIHNDIKKESVEFLRSRIISRQESIFTLNEIKGILDPNALTIGFARRFATYKRANLIFRDIERIKKILNMEDKPVQIVFSGKAHPADQPGKELIKQIIDTSRQKEFKGKVLFVEDYNIQVARYLVQGVDIWLNNPRKPLEASGTSGQKASLNGVVNFAVLDGWWVEGYNEKNGFIIGSSDNYDNDHIQDTIDSDSMYKQLENDIIPAFYDRDKNNIPQKWIKYMKNSIKSTAGTFSSDRMIKDYAEKYYIPAIDYSENIEKENYKNATKLSNYISELKSNWDAINIYSFNDSGNLDQIKLENNSTTELYIDLYLGEISKDDVKVELCIENDTNIFQKPKTYEMKYSSDILNGCHRYHINIDSLDTGQYIYSFRIIPNSQLLNNNLDIKLIRWA